MRIAWSDHHYGNDSEAMKNKQNPIYDKLIKYLIRKIMSILSVSFSCIWTRNSLGKKCLEYCFRANRLCTAKCNVINDKFLLEKSIL